MAHDAQHSLGAKEWNSEGLVETGGDSLEEDDRGEFEEALVGVEDAGFVQDGGEAVWTGEEALHYAHTVSHVFNYN